MELYQEVEKRKKTKTPMIIGICIGVLFIIIIAIICTIVYLKSTILSIRIDGKVNNNIDKILYITGEGNEQKIYIPIRQVASFFNYENYRGDYIAKSEDSTKCYVKNEYEIAMFSKDSNILIKTMDDSNYEYIKIDENVFEKDNELYTTPEGIEQAFNVLFEYDSSKNKIDIYTMTYLNQLYSSKLGLSEDENAQKEKVSEEFADKKAIFQDMIVIIKDNQYGVITASTGESVLETKYDEIKYLSTTSDFLVKSNNKYGVLGKDASVKIRMTYDDIQIMDSQNGLYLVKKNNLYGVVDNKGNVIIEPSYQQIGIDSSKYQQNGIENKYVLLNEIIPIKNSENLWGLFNIKGKKIRDFEFTEIGCSSAKESDSYPAVVIPSYKVIVVGKDKYYNLVTSSGDVLIPSYILNSVYIKYNAETGENKFYMNYNNNEKTINIEDWLASIGK